MASSKITQSLEAGTLIELFGTPAMGGFADVPVERAKVARWTRACGSRPNHVCGNAGWHIVEFAGGGKLCVHESRFRVVDNRATVA